jgi:hypothetical protein
MEVTKMFYESNIRKVMINFVKKQYDLSEDEALSLLLSNLIYTRNLIISCGIMDFAKNLVFEAIFKNEM